MEAVDRVGNRRSRMRRFYGYFPLTLTLVNEAPFTRERGKRCALFAGRISNLRSSAAKHRLLDDRYFSARCWRPVDDAHVSICTDAEEGMSPCMRNAASVFSGTQHQQYQQHPENKGSAEADQTEHRQPPQRGSGPREDDEAGADDEGCDDEAHRDAGAGTIQLTHERFQPAGEQAEGAATSGHFFHPIL